LLTFGWSIRDRSMSHLVTLWKIVTLWDSFCNFFGIALRALFMVGSKSVIINT
jgi:hypothetical protein